MIALEQATLLVRGLFSLGIIIGGLTPNAVPR